MRPIREDEIRNVSIDVSLTDTSVQPARASIEFAREEPLELGERVSICFGVGECALADLIGTPQLLQTIQRPNGNREFIYSLRGEMQAHR